MKLLLYKGKGQIGNALVRWWKRSPYSHCELMIGGFCYSSSIMDGGVRFKYIRADSDHWDAIDLPWADEQFARDYFGKTVGQPYSWLGLLKSQLINREYDELGAAFCSEWCAAALGIPNPQTYSPGTLGDLCRWLNGR